MALRALVVGGTSGIGYAMACRIAAASPSASVTISGRTKPMDTPHANIDFMPIEATSMKEIRRFTDTFKQSQVASGNMRAQAESSDQKNKLDLLVMTQGIMTMAGRTETSEGIDRKMALHYYGKQLLIRELLPVMKDGAKVVIVYDSKTGDADKLIWDDLDLKEHFGLGTAANHCMVMNDIMIQHYAAQQQNTPQRKGTDAAERRHFVHAWPGGVNTEGLMREMPWLLRSTMKMVAPLLAPLITVTPATCAEYLLDGVEDIARTTRNAESGSFYSYIDNKGRVLVDKPIFTEEQRNKIADHTWKLINHALGGS